MGLQVAMTPPHYDCNYHEYEHATDDELGFSPVHQDKFFFLHLFHISHVTTPLSRCPTTRQPVPPASVLRTVQVHRHHPAAWGLGPTPCHHDTQVPPQWHPQCGTQGPPPRQLAAHKPRHDATQTLRTRLRHRQHSMLVPTADNDWATLTP
ncbi:hypothetical protein EDB89DRAFT_1952390 [Lactarius sanguifluus]|nr:hypothetical protein EDB89DRAFT_1952390 [Lactarius sanguifluus]